MSETGIYLGNWTKIGCKMADGTVFTYSDGLADVDGGTQSIGTAATAAWQAKAVSALNDCKANETWSLDISGYVNNGSTVSYTAVYSDPTNCDPLTPSFGKLTR